MPKELIVFYSRAGENYVNGMIQNLTVGNTETAAELLHELTGAPLFRLEQANAYSQNYNECIEQARLDQKNGLRPELKGIPPQLEEYDTIYLGYPNYWNTMPMAVFTFLKHCGLSGKTIKPFCTHEGSGLGSSVKDIKRLCPNAKVENGLAILGSRVKQSRKEMEKWI